MKTKLSLLLLVCSAWVGNPARSAEAPPADVPTVPASPTVAAPSQPPGTAAVATDKPASAMPSQPTGVLLNFQNAPLADVLNYLSEAAGFVVVLEKPVEGTINVVSHQPLNPDETVDLLNAVLIEKGYTAIRNGRILKIVPVSEAAKYNLPVRVGRDPAQIPPKDQMVTQIIPVLHANALQLVENLQPLLAENATITANESSNAIVLTDTQANIRRIAEIIYALDSSISSISMVKVFPLRYADATELAKVIQQLFQSDSGNSSRGSSGIPSFIMERMRGGDRGGRNNNGASAALAAASRVVAVADERTNSLVVGAPEEVMPTIEQIVAQIDTDVADLTEVRIFRLEHSDATEMAQLLMQLFSYEDYNTSSRGSRFSGFRPPFFGGDRDRGSNNRSNQSERKLEQSRVIAVGDPRTNSLLVSASHDLMVTIAEMVARLDADTRRRQQVFVYPLEHADVDNVASILQGMFESTSTGTGTRSTSRTGRQTGTSALQQRQSSGASIAPTLGGRNTGGLGGSSGRP